MTFYDDSSFTMALCNQEKAALAEFQNIYSDELFFVSKRFCNKVLLKSLGDIKLIKNDLSM